MRAGENCVETSDLSRFASELIFQASVFLKNAFEFLRRFRPLERSAVACRHHQFRGNAVQVRAGIWNDAVTGTDRPAIPAIADDGMAADSFRNRHVWERAVYLVVR